MKKIYQTKTINGVWAEVDKDGYERLKQFDSKDRQFRILTVADELDTGFSQSTDAGVWAEAFISRNSAADRGMMVGWFANAINAGYDSASRKFQERVNKLINLRDIQCHESNCKVNDYMRGMANAFKIAVSCFDDQEPDFIPAPNRPNGPFSPESDAIDAFAEGMKKRMIDKHKEGKRGWDDLSVMDCCRIERKMLHQIVTEQYIDLANYAMILYFHSKPVKKG